MNLFLYIPTHPEHPKSSTKSLIFGQLQKYKRQNPNKDDFHNICNLLFQHLKVQGHHPHELKEHFKEGLHKLHQKEKKRKEDNHPSKT